MIGPNLKKENSSLSDTVMVGFMLVILDELQTVWNRAPQKRLMAGCNDFDTRSLLSSWKGEMEYFHGKMGIVEHLGMGFFFFFLAELLFLLTLETKSIKTGKEKSHGARVCESVYFVRNDCIQSLVIFWIPSSLTSPISMTFRFQNNPASLWKQRREQTVHVNLTSSEFSGDVKRATYYCMGDTLCRDSYPPLNPPSSQSSSPHSIIRHRNPHSDVILCRVPWSSIIEDGLVRRWTQLGHRDAVDQDDGQLRGDRDVSRAWGPFSGTLERELEREGGTEVRGDLRGPERVHRDPDDFLEELDGCFLAPIAVVGDDGSDVAVPSALWDALEGDFVDMRGDA